MRQVYGRRPFRPGVAGKYHLAMLHMLGAWFHDIDPVVLPLWGSVAIRWYGLSYIAGFAIAWLLLRWMGRRGLVLIPASLSFDFIVQVAVGVIVGGRLGYVAFYQHELLFEFSKSFPWWGVLNIAKGGMASHGGMIGMIVAAWLWARRWRLLAERDPTITPPPVLHLLDVICLIAPPGILLGRLANFVNGELLGRIVALPGEPAPWWSVRFPQELLDPHNFPPMTEAQDIMWSRMVMSANPLGDEHAAVRSMLTQIYAGNAKMAAELEPFVSARHASQLYQAFAEGLVTFIVIWWIWRKPRRPGVILAVFLIVYGAGRVATEFVRLPDAHLHVQRWLGLSRGQWLSMVMIAAGAWLLVWLSRRAGETRLGGWMRRAQ